MLDVGKSLNDNMMNTYILITCRIKYEALKISSDVHFVLLPNLTFFPKPQRKPGS